MEKAPPAPGIIHPTEVLEWKKEGFDLVAALKDRKGPFIEVGGPTPEGYAMVSREALQASGKRLMTSNISNELYFYGEDSPVKVAPVDFVADAKKLPFVDGSVGAVFMSEMVREARQEAISQAGRVLEKEGLLVVQGMMQEDYSFAAEAGFELKAYMWELQKEVLKNIPPNSDASDIEAMHKKVMHIMQEKLGYVEGVSTTYTTVLDEHGNKFAKERTDRPALKDNSGEMRGTERLENIIPDSCIFQKNSPGKQ